MSIAFVSFLTNELYKNQGLILGILIREIRQHDKGLVSLIFQHQKSVSVAGLTYWYPNQILMKVKMVNNQVEKSTEEADNIQELT